ncbi:MAG: FAD-binding oxidoreductase [Deltaproteobacteria bacterium]|nr:FAD-binding oxidoreductase [Deltaproteobacteria bacterium]MBT6498971.1 FAD-binding oxidoreductase [Deltaproteobacteria bacterium]MBT7711875.1 FAD-binding oxidoreductase [Deltaproteobacteria bacterium]
MDIKTDIIVIGGGLLGSSVAFGLARKGADVVLLDEGDMAHRAAVGNFGLVWVQNKGLGMRRYAEWAREASLLFPDFAEMLKDEIGIDVRYEKTGGLIMFTSEQAYEAQKSTHERLRGASEIFGYDGKMIDRQTAQEMVGQLRLGEKIIGASYSTHDGHLNPLLLLTALDRGFRQAGGNRFPNHAAFEIKQQDTSFQVRTQSTVFCAEKVVIAAGLGTPHLAAMVGLKIPISPQKGQVLVTERVKPVLPIAVSEVRQTDEGSFLLGNSNEDTGFDSSVTLDIMQKILARTVTLFPQLAKLNVVRTWSCLRPLTPDHMPIYQESVSSPGAFVITSHSGVSLAAMQSTYLADWILNGAIVDGFENFGLGRFHV